MNQRRAGKLPTEVVFVVNRHFRFTFFAEGRAGNEGLPRFSAPLFKGKQRYLRFLFAAGQMEMDDLPFPIRFVIFVNAQMLLVEGRRKLSGIVEISVVPGNGDFMVLTDVAHFRGDGKDLILIGNAEAVQLCLTLFLHFRKPCRNGVPVEAALLHKEALAEVVTAGGTHHPPGAEYRRSHGEQHFFHTQRFHDVGGEKRKSAAGGDQAVIADIPAFGHRDETNGVGHHFRGHAVDHVRRRLRVFDPQRRSDFFRHSLFRGFFIQFHFTA